MSTSERKHLSFGLGEPNHDGDCPRCGGGWVCLNVGRNHWAICERDQVCWSLGSNLFSSWRYETEDLWHRNAETLERCEQVEPWWRHQELWRRDVPRDLRLRNLACSHTHRAIWKYCIRKYCINVFRHRDDAEIPF